MMVLKKDGTVVPFDDSKIKSAIQKSADRVCVTLSDKQKQKVCDYVKGCLTLEETPVSVIHNLVETALDSISPKVAKSYREYRDNKASFANMLDRVYNKKLGLNFIGDRSNANSDSAIITTQRSIVYNELNSELYSASIFSRRILNHPRHNNLLIYTICFCIKIWNRIIIFFTFGVLKLHNTTSIC